MTIQQYEDYGRTLTQHVPGVETAQFCFVEEVGSTDEIAQLAKSGLNAALPLLVWEAFEEELGSGGRDNYTSRIEGSVAVLYKTERTTRTKRQARELARQALLALLEQMRVDEAGETLPIPAIRIENERATLQRTPAIQGDWYGMATSFTWRVPLDSRI